MCLHPTVARGEGAPRRRGFTLLELSVALMLGGMVLLGARALLDSLAAADEQLTRAVSRDDGVVNGERMVQAVVLNASTGNDSTARFTGDRTGAEFESWCTVPAGWQERCRVRLELRGGDGTLVFSMADRKEAVVWRRGAPAELRYLDAMAPGRSWVPRWPSSITLPAAVGVVAAGDTLVLLVGSSGA